MPMTTMGRISLLIEPQVVTCPVFSKPLVIEVWGNWGIGRSDIYQKCRQAPCRPWPLPGVCLVMRWKKVRSQVSPPIERSGKCLLIKGMHAPVVSAPIHEPFWGLPQDICLKSIKNTTLELICTHQLMICGHICLPRESNWIGLCPQLTSSPRLISRGVLWILKSQLSIYSSKILDKLFKVLEPLSIYLLSRYTSLCFMPFYWWGGGVTRDAMGISWFHGYLWFYLQSCCQVPRHLSFPFNLPDSLPKSQDITPIYDLQWPLYGIPITSLFKTGYGLLLLVFLPLAFKSPELHR